MKREDTVVIVNGTETDLASLEGFKAEDFDLGQIFDCGQCFRWFRNEDGIWETPEQIDDLRFYFDMDRDYGMIKEKLADGDPVMAKAIEAGSGIRILNQPKWETLVTFIISQNNNIPRIKKCINSLAGVYGHFPTAEELASSELSDIACCRLGYRDKYLIETAKMVRRAPEELEELYGAEEAFAVEALRKYPGVGPKVANCVALFCLGIVDSFPVDVWMKRVMNQLYGIPEGNVAAMHEYAREHFAPYGGIAQQYLFYYITHMK